MAFYLKIIGGADDGTTHRIDAGDTIVGRAPTAKIQLSDESIAWEHVTVKDAGTRLVVTNLSAAGTKVRGKRITEETRVASGDEIILSPKVKAVVESRAAGAGAGLSRTTLILLFAVVLVLVGLGAVLLTTGKKEFAQPPMTGAHWRQAYARICDRMETWVSQDRFPQEALVLYKDAWRFENAGNIAEAANNWNKLQNVLRSLPAPNDRGGLSTIRISEAAGPTYTALGIIMGWNQAAATAEFNWDGDEALADALVWFVRKRADITNASVKE